jgi:hypothetical protein
MHQLNPQKEYSTLKLTSSALSLGDMLKDCKATLEHMKSFDSFESPKACKKLEFIYKKHFPEQPELAHSASVYSNQSTQPSSQSMDYKKISSKAAHNAMNKILEEIKQK